jgi:hypothetical protein
VSLQPQGPLKPLVNAVNAAWRPSLLLGTAAVGRLVVNLDT